MEIAILFAGYWAIGRLMFLGLKASKERDELKEAAAAAESE